LVVVDGAWKTCSVAAEIAATVADEAFFALKAPIVRVCLPDVPAPSSQSQELAYYITDEDILHGVQSVLESLPGERRNVLRPAG
jgi:pyruvate dehydrogenase E1 component beta subunit